jgi:hypothetical protein
MALWGPFDNDDDKYRNHRYDNRWHNYNRHHDNWDWDDTFFGDFMDDIFGDMAADMEFDVNFKVKGRGRGKGHGEGRGRGYGNNYNRWDWDNRNRFYNRYYDYRGYGPYGHRPYYPMIQPYGYPSPNIIAPHPQQLPANAPTRINGRNMPPATKTPPANQPKK